MYQEIFILHIISASQDSGMYPWDQYENIFISASYGSCILLPDTHICNIAYDKKYGLHMTNKTALHQIILCQNLFSIYL